MFGNSEQIVQQCEKQRTFMWNEFNRIKPKLTEIARHFYPQSVPSLERDIRDLNGVGQTEEDDDLNRMTGVPRDAFRICVNGFYVHLTGPNAHWFKLGNPKFGKTDAGQDDFFASVYEQLTDATDWLIKWAGIYKQVHILYRHLTAFGFAAMLASHDDERYVRCETLRIGTYALNVDHKGRVNRVCRHFAFNAEQMIEEFGIENVGDNIIEAARNGDTKTMYEVWNIIEPHKKIHKIKSPYTLSYSKFSYRSVYWTSENKNKNNGLLAVRGYEVKPIVCPRINHENGDIYGRGLCADILGHARMLQSMREDCLDIDDQNAHPSMMAPASMADDGLHLDPLSVNYYPDGLGKDGVYRTIRDGLNTEPIRLDAEICEHEIRKALLNTEFETISSMQDSTAGADDMTATEVRARIDEKLEQLSGIATTLNEEWLDPFVTMIANFVKLASINSQKYGDGALPAIINFPEQVINSKAPFDIKYESKIHAAANASIVNAGFTSIQHAAMVAEQVPEILDNFDFDEVARETHRMIGAPEGWLRTTMEIEDMRKARAEAQAQQAQTEQAALKAKTLRDIASSPIDPTTIGGIMAGVGAQGGK